MVTLYRKSRWKIALYGSEHGLPHFHIEGPNFRCSVNIETLEIIIGEAPAAVISEAQHWAKQNQVLLRAKWRELNG